MGTVGEAGSWRRAAGDGGRRRRDNGEGADSAGIGLGRARDGAVEVRGEVGWLGKGSGLKNGGETARAMSGGKRRLCFACRLCAGARREEM